LGLETHSLPQCWPQVNFAAIDSQTSEVEIGPDQWGTKQRCQNAALLPPLRENFPMAVDYVVEIATECAIQRRVTSEPRSLSILSDSESRRGRDRSAGKSLATTRASDSIKISSSFAALVMSPSKSPAASIREM